MSDTPTITRQLVEGEDRMQAVERRFGIHWPFMLEPLIFSLAAKMTRDVYQGGYWNFFELSNGGCYVALDSDQVFRVFCDNCWEGDLSADALSIVCCLYAFSHLSFSKDERFGRVCADYYHWLREYLFGHAEAANILRAID
jgi:hypothetical protein